MCTVANLKKELAELAPTLEFQVLEEIPKIIGCTGKADQLAREGVAETEFSYMRPRLAPGYYIIAKSTNVRGGQYNHPIIAVVTEQYALCCQHLMEGPNDWQIFGHDMAAFPYKCGGTFMDLAKFVTLIR